MQVTNKEETKEKKKKTLNYTNILFLTFYFIFIPPITTAQFIIPDKRNFSFLTICQEKLMGTCLSLL